MSISNGEKRMKGAQKIFEKIIAENFQNLLKTLIYMSKMLNEIKIRYMQRDPHPNTSW